MISLAIEIHKTRILVGSIIVALLLWAITASIFLLIHDEKTVLISVENGRARILSADSESKEEAAAFIKNVLENLYNFNTESFSKNVGLAVDAMSAELWSKEKEKFLSLKNTLKENNISQSAIIEKINLLEDGRYEAVLNVLLNIRVSREAFTQKVILGLKKIKRSEQNPWGLEVVELNEARM